MAVDWSSEFAAVVHCVDATKLINSAFATCRLESALSTLNPQGPAIQDKEIFLLAEPEELRTQSLGSWGNFVAVAPLQHVVRQVLIIRCHRQEGLQLFDSPAHLSA